MNTREMFDLEGQVAPRSVERVGDGDEVRLEAPKLIQGAEEVADALLGLRGEELEGEHGLTPLV